MENDLSKKLIEWIERIRDKASCIKGVKYGKLIIVIGGRGNGKSELVKELCKIISGKKYVIKVDENLNPTKIPEDDKHDYGKIPGCYLIEREDSIDELSDVDDEYKNTDIPSGLIIFEDFPALSEKGKRAIYNSVKDCRHEKTNYIIIAHDYDVLKETVFKHASAICIFKDAAINALQLNTRLNDLSKAHAVMRAKRNLKEYQYIFVSFDDKKWHKNFLDSRNVDVLRRFLRGKLNDDDLQDIDYPKDKKTKSSPNTETKKHQIEKLIEKGVDIPTIVKTFETSEAYVWKIRHYMRRKYIEENGPGNIPSYLRDFRRGKRK